MINESSPNPDSPPERRRVIVVHGAFGSPEINWFPWLRTELGDEYDVVTPRFPTPENQNLTSWLAVFDEQVAPLRASDILVGHSIGAGFLVRVLERRAPTDGPHVVATALVCGFMTLLDDPDVDPINATIVEGPCDWATARARGGVIRAWHGTDDPYVPEAANRDLADQLLADFVVLRGAQHINGEAGITEFPELAAFIRGLDG
ncbi:MAG: RBBP9/YdeN family alpha/beta hydrolase [Acidimicrobiia bacterium]